MVVSSLGAGDKGRASVECRSVNACQSNLSTGSCITAHSPRSHDVAYLFITLTMEAPLIPFECAVHADPPRTSYEVVGLLEDRGGRLGEWSAVE